MRKHFLISKGIGFLAGMVCAAALTAGCARKATFQNVDLTGNTRFGNDFALPDARGKIRTLADFKGKVVVLFFGYTHCPDICPTTLAELAQAFKQLGPDAKRVQVVFVTVDPARDTPRVLARYVPAFEPSFIGLRPANEAQLKKVTQDFRIYYAKTSGTTPDDDTIEHTAASYIFDPTGRLRLYAHYGQGVTRWVHDIRLLLK